MKTKQMCQGCRNDFYNGHNLLGVKECWSFERADVVEKMRVGTWQNPPYTWAPKTTLTCYSPEGGVMIGRGDSRVVEAAECEKGI